MSDVKTTLTWLLRDQVSGTARTINGNLDKVGLKAKSTGANMGILAGAALATGAVLVGFAQKAADEEVGIARLGASLRANVTDWDGNTESIERTISMREKLAFSDDDLRNSLGLLVASTHDVTKAWEIQSVAMDLARFKNIDLETATEALIKMEGGSFKALKALIGSTKDITTAEEALAAVRKLAAGQADAYAETTKGKLDRLGIAWEDMQEEAGVALVNVADGWGFLVSKIANTINPVEANILRVDKAALRVKNAMVGIEAASDAIVRDKWGKAILQQVQIAESGGLLTGLAETFRLIDEAVARAGLEDLGHQAGKKQRGGGTQSGGIGPGKASGGPVSAGMTYTVGEHGPETLVMGGGSGTIVPNGGGGHSHDIIIDGQRLGAAVEKMGYYAGRRAVLTVNRT